MVMDAAEDVAGVDLHLDIAGAQDARTLRDRLSAQLRTHLVPRLRQVDQPAVVVLGGSTGAGKSTIVNSLVRAEVSPAGVLRPTTRKPVLLVNPTDEAALADHPLAASTVTVTHSQVPSGLALLDTPDLDSVNDANRALGTELLEAADLWVFVTTAARYGDALPWATLRAAHARGVTVVVVLNRVSEEALADVRADLLNRLVAGGMGASPLFVLPDLGPHEGPIPPGRLADLDRWLELLAARTRGALVARTIRGTWPSLRQDLLDLADAAEAQVAAVARLETAATERAGAHAERVTRRIEAGDGARGGPTTRWLALASSGGPLSPLVAGARRVRRRGRGSRDRASAVVGLRDVVTAHLTLIVSDGAAAATRDIRTAWAEPGAGGASLASAVTRAAPAGETTDRVRARLRAWAEVVEARIAGEPSPEGHAGRLLDPTGWAALTCVAAAGLDGASRAVDTAFGDRGPALREEARTALLDAAAAAIRAEAAPFVAAVGGLGGDETAALALRVRASELRGVV